MPKICVIFFSRTNQEKKKKYMADLPEPQQGTAAGWQNRNFVYGLEKIVLLPRTWSVRFFAQKTRCLVASIVTLRIWVETDPGHDYWRKLAKVCQADLDLKDWVRFHGDIWKESEPRI